MNYRPLLVTLVLALAALTVSEHTWADTNDIVQVPLNGPINYELPNGDTRVLEPSCASGPTVNDDGEIEATDPQYSFLIQMGNPKRLLFVLDGGGACWDALTCLGTPLLGISTYEQTVDETPATVDSNGGVFDLDNPNNPYRTYTKVFIPYCSADVHWGSRDKLYSFPRDDQDDFKWLIRHRGADNFLAVLHWLRTAGPRKGLMLEDVRNLTISGASAGAYGAMVAFPYIAELSPRARLQLIADAGIGVINESFFKTAVYNPGSPGTASWAAADSLPTFIGLDESFLTTYAEQPLFLVPAWFAELSRYKPRARMAMVTSNLDSTQLAFYALMELLGGRQGHFDRLSREWYVKMQMITNAAEALPNYRSFVEEGTYHTILGSDRYYETGESGISFRDWNKEMISFGATDWETIDVGTPFYSD